MRKRNVQILFRMTEEEAEYLYELVRKSGYSKEALLRAMVKGYRLCEKPDPEFYKILRELSAIGNRINQLAAKANALDYIDTPMLQEEAARWRQFQTDVRKAYLLPKRGCDGYRHLLLHTQELPQAGGTRFSEMGRRQNAEQEIRARPRG